MTEVDYRELLMKYIQHVIDQEGVALIEPWRVSFSYAGNVQLSEAEFEELNRLAAEGCELREAWEGD